jgi:hypothetical protein
VGNVGLLETKRLDLEAFALRAGALVYRGLITVSLLRSLLRARKGMAPIPGTVRFAVFQG